MNKGVYCRGRGSSGSIVSVTSGITLVAVDGYGFPGEKPA